MKRNTEVAVAGGVALGAALSGLIPKDWPIWQEVAVVAVVCGMVYALAKVAWRSTDSGADTK
jgi:hypothetical protein